MTRSYRISRPFWLTSSGVTEPASSEIESLLFTLQGSIGTAVIFYILGYYRGRREDHAGD